MKKKILFLASVLLSAASISFAQTDSTGSSAGQKAFNTQPTNAAVTGQSGEADYANNMTLVKPSDLPADLQSTLRGSKYKGWENGKVYRSRGGDAFVVETTHGDKVETHRFDGNGKPLKDQ